MLHRSVKQGRGIWHYFVWFLERSNVDITEELVNLITAQRNFKASAKVMETTTTLLRQSSISDSPVAIVISEMKRNG